MGVFDFLKGKDIHEGLKNYEAAEGALLLDVRTQEEYREAHVPGAVNLPLQNIDRIGEIAADTKTPLFVYCHSGGRSKAAAAILRNKGYAAVTDLGGMSGYRGKVERG